MPTGGPIPKPARWPLADSKVTDTGVPTTGLSQERQVLPRRGSRKHRRWTMLFSGCSRGSQEEAADGKALAGRPPPRSHGTQDHRHEDPGPRSTPACTTDTQEIPAGQTWKKHQLWGSRPESRNRIRVSNPPRASVKQDPPTQAVGKKTAALLSLGPRGHGATELSPASRTFYLLPAVCDDTTDRNRGMRRVAVRESPTTHGTPRPLITLNFQSTE